MTTISTVAHRVRESRRTPAAPLAPGPRGRAVGRELLRIQRGPLEAFDLYAQRYGDVTQVSFGPFFSGFFLRGSEQVRHVLITNQDNYKKSNQYSLLARVLGKGLVTSEGELWRRQRSLVQPMFAKRHLTPFAEHMASAATASLDGWDRTLPDGTPLEMVEQMSHMTLDVVGRALVGNDFTQHAEAFGVALGSVLHEVGAAGRTAWVQGGGQAPYMTPELAFKTLPRRWARYTRNAQVLDDVIVELIERRSRETPAADDKEDLLRLLVDARDEATGEGMTPEQARDELMTFVTAGHETTANGLTWMWYLLSQNPVAREQLLAEVDEVLGGRVPTPDDLDLLPWTTACFQEAMRLYPPVWHVQRQAIADDVVGGYHVPAGSLIFIGTWTTHRDPSVWPNPAGFDPRRFIGDAPKQRPRQAYLPFAGGRRNCVGQGFAMMEATILTAMISQRFTFDFIPGSPVVPDPTVTLRPLYGMPMRINRR